MAHYEVSMNAEIAPFDISFGSSMGPTVSVDVVFVGSGYRFANSRWSQKLRKYSLQFTAKEIEIVYKIRRFWEAMDGPLNSFLIRDWADWNTTQGSMTKGEESLITATDQPLQNTVTLGFQTDGGTNIFQAVKQYSPAGAGGPTHTRTIKKIDTAAFTPLVAINGVTIAASNYTLDATTGIFTFGSPSPPIDGGSPTAQSITWGGAFYVPVSFVAGEFESVLRTLKTDGIASIELIEERL